MKAEQIRQSRAKIVVTSCHNCLVQLQDISRHYKLGVQVKSLSEIVADAII